MVYKTFIQFVSIFGKYSAIVKLSITTLCLFIYNENEKNVISTEKYVICVFYTIVLG